MGETVDYIDRRDTSLWVYTLRPGSTNTDSCSSG